jgi:hypothetical protein
MVAASGLIWYGGGPLIFAALYTVVWLVAKLASATSWWILPAGFVACTIPLVRAGLQGRRRLAGARIELKRR